MSEIDATPGTSLAHARELAAARDWRGLAEWGASLPGREQLEPELSYLYADACRRTGDTPQALAVLTQTEPRVRQSGDRGLLLRTVNLAGMILFESARVPEAEERFLELLEVATAAKDDEFAARACNNLGAVANLRGDRERALTNYTRALASYQRIGWTRGLAQTHYNLGLSFRDLGYLVDADTHFRRAIDFASSADSEEVVAMAEVERAGLRVRAGDGAMAAEMARLALGRFERLSDPLGRAEALRVLGLSARAQGQNQEAVTHLSAALQLALQHEDSLLRAEIQRDRGMLLRGLEDLAGARAAFEDAIEHYARIGAGGEAEALRVIVADL